MELKELIQHPERLDREALYELRSTIALYPYFQTARILMLQALYLLHDPSFDEELRRAAIYISDRRVLFQMIEAAHYQLRALPGKTKKSEQNGSRTISLIDTFLDSIPHDEDNKDEAPKRRPTPADAAIDYVAYLLETENESDDNDQPSPQLKGHDLIDSFLENDQGKIVLNDNPTLTPVVESSDDAEAEEKTDEGYFTETLARIYIKQGRYSKALEIIKRLSLQYPKKNAYFADQIRFLEKLIINNNKKQ